MTDLLPVVVGAVVGVGGYVAGVCYTRWLLNQIGDTDD